MMLTNAVGEVACVLNVTVDLFGGGVGGRVGGGRVVFGEGSDGDLFG